jgi:hypothetical protein
MYRALLVGANCREHVIITHCVVVVGPITHVSCNVNICHVTTQSYQATCMALGTQQNHMYMHIHIINNY